MVNRVLLDTNVLIRFFEGPSAKEYPEAVGVMEAIERGDMEAVLLDMIVAEALYVLLRIYKRERKEIATVLQRVLSLPHLHSENQAVLFAALDRYADENIDFADAVLCAKKEIEGYTIVSFDKKVRKC